MIIKKISFVFMRREYFYLSLIYNNFIEISKNSVKFHIKGRIYNFVKCKQGWCKVVTVRYHSLHFYRISWMVHLNELSNQTLVETSDFLLEQSTSLYIFISGVSNYK